MSRRALLAALAGLSLPLSARAATLDAARIEQSLRDRWTDVDSVVVLASGGTQFEYYRDGDPARPRAQQSVAKSALSALVGCALRDGHLPDLDRRVLEIVPAWAGENDDPRAQAISVRHLLTMTAGFAVNDPTGTARPPPNPGAWRRPFAAAPGERFAYDNGSFVLLLAVLEAAVRRPVAEYARTALAQPLGLSGLVFESGLAMPTRDMARLGQLYLQQGQWEGRELIPGAFVAESTRAQNGGGPPAMMAYGYLWWILPGPPGRQAWMASGWGGQMIRVDPVTRQVIAMTCPASPGSQQRRHWLELMIALL